MNLHRRAAAAVVVAGGRRAGRAAGAVAQAQEDTRHAGHGARAAPGLDPTIAPAAAIGEIVHYNILEGLTKINVDGSVTPLLAESWTMDPDGKSYTFKLRKGVKFHDGEAFDSSAVKFSFERAKDEKSTNKAKKRGVRQHQLDHRARPAHGDPDAEQRRRQLPLPHGREHRGDPASRRARPTHRDQAGRHRALSVRGLEEGQLGHADQVGRLSRCQVDQDQAR